jgi:hypothetical protein
MSAERLKNAFSSYRRVDEAEAERRLLGRSVDEDNQTSLSSPSTADAVTSTSTPPKEQPASANTSVGTIATSQLPATYQVEPSFSNLIPRPVKGPPEPTTQVSFRLPNSLASRFRRIAKYNQLEQQAIIREALEMILPTLPQPPEGWMD